MAKVMFFNGLSRTTKLGDIAYLYNPYIADNLAFSFQMQLTAAEYYPGYTRKIYLKGYRFNMHYCPKTLLVEVGAQTNHRAGGKKRHGSARRHPEQSTFRITESIVPAVRSGSLPDFRN